MQLIILVIKKKYILLKLDNKNITLNPVEIYTPLQTTDTTFYKRLIDGHGLSKTYYTASPTRGLALQQ